MSVLWCQGMFASGSTWLYNVALAVCGAVEPRLPVRGRFVFDLGDTAGLEATGLRHVVKAHQAPDSVATLAARSQAILVTVRDPRDAACSLMQYQGFSFYRALHNVRLAAEACYRLACCRQAVVLHYERGFIDDPATLDGLAGHVGGAISRPLRDRIFAEHRREAVEARLRTLAMLPTTITDRDGDMYDLATHWHRHHAGRSGESGRWRRLLHPAQVAGLEAGLADWMECFGYPTETLRSNPRGDP